MIWSVEISFSKRAPFHMRIATAVSIENLSFLIAPACT